MALRMSYLPVVYWCYNMCWAAKG